MTGLISSLFNYVVSLMMLENSKSFVPPAWTVFLMLTEVLYSFVARKGESYGYRDGREAYKCVLGQMHHWHPWQQVQLRGIDLSYQLRPAVYGHEPHHHETVSVHAITYLPIKVNSSLGVSDAQMWHFFFCLV